MQKVLIANRGEIAVRIARACTDAGLIAVGVYAAPDRDALHVRRCDEAFSLDGSSPADTYLNIAKMVDIARRSGADAVHPGYGFLAENADFARACIDAGLIWIGPSPDAIDSLGDKVSARHIAAKVGAPLVAGTADPVADEAEVLAFADEHGLPIAIKAAFGGGGRGLKVARTREEVGEQFDSAVREALAAFGRGECFVERYLDRPRHVETQCLADSHGNVVVLSTRDCSLQRRHQKLIEEAPAPYLTEEQESTLYTSSKAILNEAGYVGAGTCEFLIGTDGTLSFLEVNTRLQVEHTVTEEVTGIDIVREMFRIADGEKLGYTDPPARGHSIEFRINAEDPGRGFLPAPGRLTSWRPPDGPGIRLDSGYGRNETVPGAFDSLIAKLIVTGADREQALQRSRRALREFRIKGMPTVLPFHRAVVDHPAFTAENGDFAVHTGWIEGDFTDSNNIPPYTPEGVMVGDPDERTRVVVEVAGRRLEVALPASFGGAVNDAATQAASGVRRAVRRATRDGHGRSHPPAVSSGHDLTAPMQGTIVRVEVEEGQEVAEGDLVIVLEAMKMEQPIKAHRSGTVRSLSASVGDTVTAGHVLAAIVD
jgi:acetyl-CoA/propionyl-CoA carboxylase biotin carboxyl carrier protein